MLNAMRIALVIIHVGAGTLALLTGVVAMASRKGGRLHRRWGKIYFWSMATIFVSALLMLAFRPNIFLFVISVLSFYNALSGVRALSRKNPSRGEGPTRLDWAAALIAATAGAGFIGWGLLGLAGFTDWPTSFMILGIVFGGLLARDAVTDLISYRRPPTDRHWWWYYHLVRMVGSYTAAVTAFLVQNVGPRVPAELGWIVWIAPTLITVPTVVYWIAHYRRKFAGASEPQIARG